MLEEGEEEIVEQDVKPPVGGDEDAGVPLGRKGADRVVGQALLLGLVDRDFELCGQGDERARKNQQGRAEKNGGKPPCLHGCVIPSEGMEVSRAAAR